MSTSAQSAEVEVEITGTQQLLQLPWRDTNYSPLTGIELRNLVVEAALNEERCDEDDAFLDVPGVAWMEHINLIVGHTSEDRKIAEAFYIDVMGLTPDKGNSFHVNMGRQQFHLATPKEDDEIPHRIHGSVGLVVPDIDALWVRLDATREDYNATATDTTATTTTKNDWFRGTLFDFYKEEGENENEDTTNANTVIHVRCPWGNVFRCFSASDRGSSSKLLRSQVKTEPSPQKMTNLHSPQIGVHGADKMGILSVGAPGIRFVEFVLPAGVRAEQVCDFYKETIRCPASVGTSSASGVDCCLVSVGPGIHLVFVEATALSSESQSDAERDLFHSMKGIHICIYAHDFYGLYRRLQDRSLIWTNPRFTRLDTCDTWEDAKRSRTLRFKRIVDPENKILMELEHETRALRHGQFMKVPSYVPK